MTWATYWLLKTKKVAIYGATVLAKNGHVLGTFFSKQVRFLAKNCTFTTVTSGAAAIFGTLASLNFGLTKLLHWWLGPPRMSKQARLERVLSTLEVKKTLLVERKEAYSKRMERIALLLHNIQRTEGPIRNRMRAVLDKTVKTQQEVLKSKEIPRLNFTIALLEDAKEKLQDEDEN